MATNPKTDSDKMFLEKQRVNSDDILNSIYEAEQQQGESYQVYLEAVRLNSEKVFNRTADCFHGSMPLNVMI
jgi:hypothetical protein